MKHFTILLISTFLLSGCAKDNPTQAIIDNANTALTEIKETLPPECQTKEVFAKIDKVQAIINIAPETCELMVDRVRVQRDRYAMAFFAMLAVGMLSLFRRFYR